MVRQDGRGRARGVGWFAKQVRDGAAGGLEQGGDASSGRCLGWTGRSGRGRGRWKEKTAGRNRTLRQSDVVIAVERFDGFQRRGFEGEVCELNSEMNTQIGESNRALVGGFGAESEGHDRAIVGGRKADGHDVVEKKGLLVQCSSKVRDLVFSVGMVAGYVLGKAVGEFGEVKLSQVTTEAVFGQGKGMRFGGGLGGRDRAFGEFDRDLIRFASKVNSLEGDAGHGGAEFGRCRSHGGG